MNSRTRLALVVLGVLSALSAAELTLRIFEDELPVRSAWPTVETELKNSQLSAVDDWDVVFLGSSVTEAAIDPRLLTGVTAYNAALPFSTPISHEVWYSGQFSDRQGRIVVLGLPAWPYHQGIEDDRIVSGIEAAIRDGTMKAPRLAIIAHRGVIADWFGLRSREVALESHFWTPQGHLTAYYSLRSPPLTGSFQPFGPPEMSEDVRTAIHRLAEYVRLQGGTLVLMIEPARFPGKVSDQVLQRYLATVNDLAKDLNVDLWDTFAIGWADDLYADDLHFNRRGTEAFSELVNQLLARER